MKIGSSVVSKVYFVCTLLQNIRTCLYGNQISEFFQLEFSWLVDYFQKSEGHFDWTASLFYSHTLYFFAFECNAKKLCNSTLVFFFFFSFSFPPLFLEGLPKVFWTTFNQLLPMKRVTKIRIISLDILKRVSVNIAP